MEISGDAFKKRWSVSPTASRFKMQQKTDIYTISFIGYHILVLVDLYMYANQTNYKYNNMFVFSQLSTRRQLHEYLN